MSDFPPDDHDAFMHAAAEIELCAEDRIEEMQRWIVSHPAEVLALLVESGHLELRHLMPIGPHIAQYRDAWRLLTPENAREFAPELLTDCWVPGASTLPPLIGEEEPDAR